MIWFILKSDKCHWGAFLLWSQRFWQSVVCHGSVSFNSLAVNLKPVVGLWEPAHCDLAHVTDWHDGCSGWALRKYISLCTKLTVNCLWLFLNWNAMISIHLCHFKEAPLWAPEAVYLISLFPNGATDLSFFFWDHIL